MWQPIETAPRNVPVLVWLEATNTDGTRWGAWPAMNVEEENGDGRFWQTFGYECGVLEWGDACRPTHWCTVPNP